MIEPDNIFAMTCVLSGLAFFGFWVDGTELGRKTSGVVWVILLGILLSNTGVIPTKSEAYDFVGGVLMPMAIPLLLIKADLRRIFRESGRVMIGFGIAAVSTITGALIGYFLLDLGDIGPKAAAVYTAGWIGGAVNFVAVSEAVSMTPDEFSVAMGASSPVSVIALMALLTLPSIKLLRRWLPSAMLDGGDAGNQTLQMKLEDLQAVQIVGLIAISGGICGFAELISDWAGYPQYYVLVVTLLALFIANMFPKYMDRLRGEFSLAMLLMYLFFAAIGCGTDATSFLGSALILFFYGLMIIGVHLLVLIAVSRFFKLDIAEVVIASAAALVGPAPAAAIASARQWPSLVTPGLMCGIFGYAIANFVGVAIGSWLAG